VLLFKIWEGKRGEMERPLQEEEEVR